MGIDKFEHQNGGTCWIIDDPKSMDSLDEEAMNLLAQKQLDFFIKYPASIHQFIDKAIFPEFREWLVKLSKTPAITLEIYGKGYIDAEVLFCFKNETGKSIYISCEPLNKSRLIDNKKILNIAETVGKISTEGYSTAGGLNIYDVKNVLYSTLSGEELICDRNTNMTYWNFKPMGMDDVSYKPLDDFLDEFFKALNNETMIYPDESFE